MGKEEFPNWLDKILIKSRSGTFVSIFEVLRQYFQCYVGAINPLGVLKVTSATKR